MKFNRRNFVALCGLATGAAVLSNTAKRVAENFIEPKNPDESQFCGFAPEPEFTVDPQTGELILTPGQQVCYSVCMGCTTLCGVRVRFNKETGKMLRVTGNPYNPLSLEAHLPMKTSVKESYKAISSFQDKGLDGRATACGRGNAIMEYMDSPLRVLHPMKRVGPRNSGQWKSISFEELIKEIVHGGDLFGEGHVQGLLELRDLQTPLNPNAPEFGPKTNQVGVLTSVNEGREAFARRFWNKSFGTQNFVGHGSYCGGSYRSGSGALFGDLKGMPHGKPDISNAEFVMFIGTAPGNAGNPFKHTGALIAEARTKGNFRYVVVDPVLTNADNQASAGQGHWVPIRPGTDGALIMGMIRWMFENQNINSNYLSCPNQNVADSLGEASFTSASWLVITNPAHPRSGAYLRGSDLGMNIAEDKRYSNDDPYMVLDQNGQLATAQGTLNPAQILPENLPASFAKPDGTELELQDFQLKTALALLKESAEAQNLEDYSKACGIAVSIIEGLAKEFTSHGRKASAIAHGGMMSGSGFYNAYGVVTLNALIGSLNWKGGFVMNGGGFKDAGEGPRYNLDSFPGQVTTRGLPLGRNVPFEKTTEFKNGKEQGQPYPARDAWFPNAPGLATEWFQAMLRGYPYSLKALVLWICNPLYGIPGLTELVKKDLTDSKKLPLIISVDTLINETNTFADYIIPDSLMYESWGWVAPWNGVPTKTMSARWPIMEPKTAKTADGQPITMESFFIALAKAMDLPGFGPQGLTDANGTPVPLESAEDWYLRGGANIAFLGEKPVDEATDEDLEYSGVARLRGALESRLTPEEWRRVALLYTRGGRFQPAQQAQDAENKDWQNNRFKKVVWLWNDTLATSKNSLTGKKFWGSAQWHEPCFADGSPVRQHYPENEWPMLLMSFKSHLHNACSIATSLNILSADNPLLLHSADAAKHQLSTGDRIRVSTPGGTAEGTVIVHNGVMPGVIGFEHGYGHSEIGAREHLVDGKPRASKDRYGEGLNINDLGLTDPSRKHEAVWVDWVSGAAVRNGLPAKIEKIG